MAGISVASLQALNSQGALKITNKALLMGDSTASLVTDPFDGTGLLQSFPAGYYSGGIVTSDGFKISRSLKVDTVMSDQLVQPDRADVSEDAFTFEVKFQDVSNKVVQAIDNGLTLAAISSLTPFFSATHNSSGVQPQRRICLVGEDTTRNVTLVRFFPNCTLNAAGDQVWQRSTEVQYDHTFGAYPDSGLLDADGNPTDSAFWIGGSGWASLVGDEALLSVTPSAETLSLAGTNTQQLVVKSGGTDVTATATYVSAATSTATVSASGLVTGVAAGSTTVTVTYNGQTVTNSVTVTA